MSEVRIAQIQAALKSLRRMPIKDWEAIEIKLILSLMLEFMERTGKLDAQDN